MKGSNDAVKMGNCFPFVRRKKKGNREITLAILGLDNAGKTSTTRSLQGESLETITPTVGFENIEFSIDNFNVTMFDLGGGRTIRAIWQNYFSEVHGVVYVVDSSDSQRLNECKEVLTKLISDPRISGKPLLLLANKQDLDSALDDGEIVEELDIEHVINYYKCPCRVERCSATIGVGKKMDKSIRTGFQWLLGYIEQNLSDLEARVKADMKIREEQLAREKEERRERVRRIKEERERERKARGEIDEDNEDSSAVDPQINPFKPLTVDNDESSSKVQSFKLDEDMMVSSVDETNQKSSDIQNSQSQIEHEINELKLTTKTAPEQEAIYSDISGSRVNTSLFITSEDGSGDHLMSSSQKSLQTGQVSTNGGHLPPLESPSTKHRKKKKRKSKKNRLVPAEENPESDVSPVKRYSNPNIFLTENILTLNESSDKEINNCKPSNTNDSRLLPNSELEDIIT